LVVAKQFIELHNGTIELESKLGVGTKVTLTLPINKVD
jgi:signal transduction histidine kinase